MNPLRILTLNANGLAPRGRSRIPLLADILAQHSVDVAMVQETLLTARRRAAIQGYRHYRTNKADGSRGLSMFVKDTLRHAQLATPQTAQLQAQAISAMAGATPITIVNVYNSNHGGMDVEELDTLLHTGNRVILAGDLNAKHCAWQSDDTQGQHRNSAGTTLYNHCAANNYHIIAPTTPTRTDPRNGNTSTLDIALASKIPYYITAETLPCVGSDHNPVLLTVHNASPRHAAPQPRLNYKKADWPRFGQSVHNNLKISRFNTKSEVDQGVAHLITVIQEAMASSIPKTTTTRTPDQLPPHLQALKRTKNAAKRKWLRNRRAIDRNAHNLARKLFEKQLAEWQNQKWSDTLKKVSNHTDVWKLAKALKRKTENTPPLTTQTGIAHTAEEKAAAISHHFEAVHKQNDHMGSPADAERVSADLAAYIHAAPDTPVKPTTPQEIRNIIKSRHPRKAPGPDDIQNIVLQHLPRKAIAYLTVLFNACLALAYFPAEWKHANVLPFPKPGKDCTLPQNYRPISLLSAISKLLERIINTRLLQHLDSRDLLNLQQFGFTKGYSTTHQVARLADYITDGFNRGLHTGVVMLDASAAFDTVWTEGLLYKMAAMEFPVRLIKLLHSYLNQRSFHVSLEGAKSPAREAKKGTPQGSILGPVLYIIYVNDIPRPGRALLAQYADDTAIFYQAADLPSLVTHLQRTLDALLEYFWRWRIKINAQKTEAVLFSKRRVDTAADHRLHVDATPLPWLQQARFLGVILDRRMTFGAHIRHIQKKAAGAMSVIYPMIRRSSAISPDIKVRLALAYVRPIMTYAAPAWTGMVSDTNLMKLQVIQNKYLRWALNLAPLSNMKNAHKQHNIQLIGDYIVKLTTQFYEKCKTHTNPHILALGAITPETAAYRLKHKTPTYRLLLRDN